MAKWSMGLALAVMGMMGTASAQFPSWPSHGQSGPVTEPIPYMAAPQPPSAPQRPFDTSSPCSLPGDLPNAWCEEEDHPPPATYASLGYMAFLRQRPGHNLAAVLDTASGGIDTGIPAPAGSVEALDFHDIDPRWNHGVRASIGYHSGNHAFELSGFYLSQNSSSKLVAVPGQLDVPFNVNGDPLTAPLGFQGDNGLWLQADIVRLQLRTALSSAEANYRFWPTIDPNFSVALGVRYLGLYERLSLYTGDDDITVLDANGNPNPVNQATYTVTANNRVVAPQLSFDWSHAFNCYLALSLSAKGAWGANFLQVDTLLKRGDGFIGFAGGRSDTIFSHLYEVGAFLDFYLAERARLRAGYDLLWAVDIAEATSQLDFNLANTNGRTNDHGSVFYHGPVVELHFMF
jgi:hypothetical protein